jgi:YD repeat-containing protein
MTGTFTDNVPPQILGTASGTAAQVVEAPDTDRTTRTYYDAAGRLRYSVDAEGYLTRYGYNERGDQTSLVVFGVNHGANSARPITDSDTLATLDALTATLVAADVQHVSDYDRVGRLRTETVQTTAGAFDATRYAYDALGRLVDTTHHWNMTAWSVTHRDYDAAGRLTDVYEAYGWPAQTHVHYELDKMGNRLKIVDTRGTELAERDNVAWAQNTRVALGYPALVADLSGWQKDQLKALYTTTQEFDAVGQLIQSTDALGGVTKTAYDVFGNAVKITDPNGSVGYFYFDAENRLQLSVDPEGYATRQEYNAFDQVTKQTRYGQKVNAGYSETMSLATMLATSGTVYLNPLTAKDVVTRTEYDKRGNAKAIYDSLNVAETYTYDAFGDKRTFTDRRGSTYEYAYDHRGLLASEKSPAVYVTVVDANGVPSTSQAPVNIINKYSYDARGNLVQLREAADTAQERVTTTTYDALNRAVHTDLPAVVLFDPIAKTNSAQAVPRNIRATYDTGGNKVEAWDERSQRSLYYYDRLNRLVAQLDVDGTLHEYEYDSAGNRVHERAYGQPLAMASQTWWTRPVPAANSGYREMFYVYDANNMRIGSRTQTETLFNPDLMLQGGAGYYTSAVNTFAYYDANGNLVRSVDGRGYVTLYFYNKLGQQTASFRTSIRG